MTSSSRNNIAAFQRDPYFPLQEAAVKHELEHSCVDATQPVP